MKLKIARNLGAIRVYLAAKIDGFGARFSRRKEPPRRISRDEGQTSLRFPSAPPASFRPILGSRRKPRSVCDVVASVSSPNTQHPDKYEIPSTKHGGAPSLPLSLSRGERRKEEAARHRWWLCILEGGRGKIRRFTKNRAGGMAIERERRKESRLLGSRFGLRTRVARDRSSEYISIRDSYRLIPPPPRLYFGSSRIGVRI